MWAAVRTSAPFGHFRAAVSRPWATPSGMSCRNRHHSSLCGSVSLGALCVKESGAGHGTGAAPLPGTHAHRLRFFNTKATEHHKMHKAGSTDWVAGRYATGGPWPMESPLATYLFLPAAQHWTARNDVAHTFVPLTCAFAHHDVDADDAMCRRDTPWFAVCFVTRVFSMSQNGTADQRTE